jgi:hypothetical protein
VSRLDDSSHALGISRPERTAREGPRRTETGPAGADGPGSSLGSVGRGDSQPRQYLPADAPGVAEPSRHREPSAIRASGWTTSARGSVRCGTGAAHLLPPVLRRTSPHRGGDRRPTESCRARPAVPRVDVEQQALAAPTPSRGRVAHREGVLVGRVGETRRRRQPIGRDRADPGLGREDERPRVSASNRSSVAGPTASNLDDGGSGASGPPPRHRERLVHAATRWLMAWSPARRSGGQQDVLAARPSGPLLPSAARCCEEARSRRRRPSRRTSARRPLHRSEDDPSARSPAASARASTAATPDLLRPIIRRARGSRGAPVSVARRRAASKRVGAGPGSSCVVAVHPRCEERREVDVTHLVLGVPISRTSRPPRWHHGLLGLLSHRQIGHDGQRGQQLGESDVLVIRGPFPSRGQDDSRTDPRHQRRMGRPTDVSSLARATSTPDGRSRTEMMRELGMRDGGAGGWAPARETGRRPPVFIESPRRARVLHGRRRLVPALRASWPARSGRGTSRSARIGAFSIGVLPASVGRAEADRRGRRAW